MHNKKLISYGVVAVLSSMASGESVIAAEQQEAADSPLTITVTGTREAEPLAETSATVDAISAEEIEEIKPAHPSEVMERVPGVHVNVTGGEGHMTAIRQPLTTGPVYLYLEDGIPTRSTGFFNHNALYEVNVPQSGGVEVSKGPGTALYGSDAIGGVVNVLTKPAPLEPETELTLEGGEHGWYRMLISSGTTKDDDGIRGDLNLTHTDGWRDSTDYDRQSATVRWDHFLGSDSVLKTVLAASNIDQQTAGSSALSKDDYENDPTLNYTPISYRKVQALRLSTAYEKETADTLLSLTPYVRSNTMELLPNWSLSYDPVVYETGHDSLGLMAKYRQDFAPYRTRVIVGADIDYSPGSRDEQAITPTKEGSIYTSYTVDETLYKYDVTFQAMSPYVHAEMSPTDRLRVNAGLRYDIMSYDYDNKLTALDTGSHRRPEDTTVDYEHLSPKLGATYAFSDALNGFVSYRHAFRVPSEGQLFRPGRVSNSTELDPVKVDSYELGLRGQASTRVNYELSVYHMTKTDDIVSYNDGPDRIYVNAGETLHQGVELGLGSKLTERTRMDISYSNAKHTYEEWTPTPTVDYSGNEISAAPQEIINTRFAYRPAALNGGRVELEWQRLGKYWMDDANTHEYDGHDLLNLRADYRVSEQFVLYARVMNVADKRYATRASYNTFRGEEYAPGMPRTVYAGLTYKMK